MAGLVPTCGPSQATLDENRRVCGCDDCPCDHLATVSAVVSGIVSCGTAVPGRTYNRTITLTFNVNAACTDVNVACYWGGRFDDGLSIQPIGYSLYRDPTGLWRFHISEGFNLHSFKESAGVSTFDCASISFNNLYSAGDCAFAILGHSGSVTVSP